METVLKIGDTEALDLCTQQESDFFDRKSVRIKPGQLQNVAVAFANAEGGTVVVGIEDAKTNRSNDPLSQWQGADSIESFNPIIVALADLNPSIDFVHQFLYREGGYKTDYVLRLKIRKSQKVHETSKGEVLLRKGAQSISVTGAKIQELMRAKGVISEEDTVLPSVRAETILEGDPFKKFIANLKITDKDPFNFAVQENLLPEDMHPTVALVLLFAKNPSASMPRQCAVKIVRYDSSEEEIERDALTDDRHTIEGPLHDQIAEAFHTLKEVISRCLCWTMEGLQAPDYPDDALYELLVNSVLHRDYSISDNVLISVYRNRIEFRSPGRLPGYVTVKNIRDARFSRNPKLVRLLAKYPDAPNKDLGEGINTVYERMGQAGFIDPILREDGVNLYVVLKREPKDDPANIVTKFVSKHGAITNRQALDILALEHSEQATALFAKMREQKLLIREDEKQTGVRVRWVKPGPAHASNA
ncbi:putative DNA binding domain-containing protein [Telluria mixta]|uniref:DNA binding domain-containing protein n=1 Tax=Telluria mixta TaxID=34071 RepID=A0ABT2BTS9_9BURK|nr:ATP-binding protein [Telluria mixta]MCS0627874.1 putative DNA binding domain-containing protein [Telluria mixta]WEM94008.1 ATP-binding protein [Telluria mixta]